MRKSSSYLFVTVALVAAIFSVNIATPLGFVDWIGYLLCLLLAYRWLSRRGVLMLTVLCSLLVTLDFFFSPGGLLNTEIDITNRVIGVGILCISGYLLMRRRIAEDDREKLIVELRKALDSVKKLSGMLPICSSCKKIRDDNGYWEDVASYITDHSEALFSHGLCPECAKKAYEEIERFRTD